MQLPAVHPILEARDAAEAPTSRPAGSGKSTLLHCLAGLEAGR